MENSHGVLAVPLSTAANMLIESKALYDCREVDGASASRFRCDGDAALWTVACFFLAFLESALEICC